MRVIVNPLPVLYACPGCAEFGQIARDVGALLERGGAVEMVWLGARPEPEPKRRYPIFALDGCDKTCALRWLERHGVAAEQSWVLR